MTRRHDQTHSAAKTEMQPCALCGHGRWFHLLSRAARLSQDWRDDGHMFKPGIGRDGQMTLAFPPANVVQIPSNTVAPAPGKKPPQRAVVPAAKHQRRKKMR